MEIQVIGVQGLPLIQKGDDLPALICDRVAFEDGDILAIASSVYSKASAVPREPASLPTAPDPARYPDMT